MKESLDIKAYRKAKKQLEKLLEKAQERYKKDIAKANLDYITVKGNECRTEDDIEDMFACDLLSPAERDKALDKLAEQLNHQNDVKTEAFYLCEAYELALNEVTSELFCLLAEEGE